MHPRFVFRALLILSCGILFSHCATSYNSETLIPENANERVILLHGLASGSGAMQKLANRLYAEGFAVTNLDYPSTKDSIQILAETAIGGALPDQTDSSSQTIHFVGHSMGCILIRYYLQNHEVENLGRVVMLSPPNHGSRVVDILGGTFFFDWFRGPGGNQITTKSRLLQSLGEPDYPVGIITGNRTINPIASWFLPGKDDGRVTIESAKLDSMRAFKVVPENHHFIMKDDTVIDMVTRFLKTGHLVLLKDL